MLLDSLDQDENNDTNFTNICWTSCPPFWFMLTTYFFELLLDSWSDFHQIWLGSSSDKAGKKLWILCWYTKPFSFSAWMNLLERCQTASESCISVKVWHIYTKLCMCHCHLTLTMTHQFGNSATYWQRVINHSLTFNYKISKNANNFWLH